MAALLVQEAARSARDDLGMEHLHLTARGGMGLEEFYERLGFLEIGRRPRALRVGPGDDRDEVLLHRALPAVEPAPRNAPPRHPVGG